jgi:hypothetical protein
MDNVEVIVSDEGIDFWEEGTQGLRVRTPCDILVNSIVLDLIENMILRIDFPELTTFKTCIVPDFLDVRGVCLHFIRRDNSERDISYVKDPIALSLVITMIYSINKAVGAQCISELWIELCPSFRCMGLGKINDSQIRKF